MENKIGIWQESFSSLSDEAFFDLIRLYLGEIKTPYNKARLIEDLARFIKNPQNTRNILSLLDDFDIKFLTAIFFINNATEDLLINFFTSDYSLGEIYSEILNLKSRLLIFEKKEENGQVYLYINPLLEEDIFPFINIKNILAPSQVMTKNIEDVFMLTPNFLASFISFVKKQGISCKLDGEIKKNDLLKIEAVFFGKVEVVEVLIKAFINLKILIEQNKKYIIDDERIVLFASLSFLHQLALISVASCSFFSRELLRKESQLLLDTLTSVSQKEGEVYTKQTIKKIAFIISNSRGDTTSHSSGRFSKILEAAKSIDSIEKNLSKADIIDCIIDSAVLLGLFQKAGVNERGEAVYLIGNIDDYESKVEKKVLNIESTFSVIILPGLSLEELLPIIDFLEIKNYGVVTSFEINKKSVSNAFDKGWTSETIFETLEKYSSYDLPQNLKVSVQEWYMSYNSARLYCGYVLKVSDANITYVENNPLIKKYIKEKLVEGVYLLNIPVNSDISFFLNECGLYFLGTIKESPLKSEKLSFPMLRNGEALHFSSNSNVEKLNFSEAKNLLDEFKSSLEGLNLTQNQYESFIRKIHSRMIISPSQLNIGNIKVEILEAEGMDYIGKVHLIEAAVNDGDMIEITLPQYNKSNEFFTLVGKPLAIYRQEADSILKMQIEPQKISENFLVSRITHVKRIKY